MVIKKEIEIGGRTLSIETGKMARQADAASEVTADFDRTHAGSDGCCPASATASGCPAKIIGIVRAAVYQVV